MNFFKTTKVFAYFFLLFANTVLANAQTESSRSVYDIEAGTKILVRMDNEINSSASSVNDTFTATLAEPLVIRNAVALPAGTTIEGKITRVRRASVGGKNGAMNVLFETIRLTNGIERQVEGVLVKELKAAETSPKFRALIIVGGAAIGGILGAVSKRSNGALIGAGIGAGAGTGAVFLQKGREVRLRADENFEIKLTKSVTVPAQDY